MVKALFLIIGIVLIVLKWREYIIINNWWIVLCFVLWFVGLYWSIHKKNKERDIPRPVYLTKQ